MVKFLMNEKFVRIFEIFLFLFGLFLLYQLILKIFGGSWNTEDIILGFLTLNLGMTFTTVMILVQLKSDHNHLKNQFQCLAKDFKDLSKDFKGLREEFRIHASKN